MNFCCVSHGCGMAYSEEGTDFTGRNGVDEWIDSECMYMEHSKGPGGNGVPASLFDRNTREVAYVGENYISFLLNSIYYTKGQVNRRFLSVIPRFTLRFTAQRQQPASARRIPAVQDGRLWPLFFGVKPACCTAVCFNSGEVIALVVSLCFSIAFCIASLGARRS